MSDVSAIIPSLPGFRKLRVTSGESSGLHPGKRIPVVGVFPESDVQAGSLFHAAGIMFGSPAFGLGGPYIVRGVHRCH